MRAIKLAALLVLQVAALSAQAQSMPPLRASPGLMPNPAVGKKLFAERCAQCHGADLRGSTSGPPLVHPIYKPSHHADIAFQLAVRNGSRAHHWRFGDMKPVPGLTPDDVAHITAYVRSEQRKAGIQ